MLQTLDEKPMTFTNRIKALKNVLSEWSYWKLVAALLILGAVLANIAFIGLGSVFNYSDILQEPIRCPRH